MQNENDRLSGARDGSISGCTHDFRSYKEGLGTTINRIQGIVTV